MNLNIFGQNTVIYSVGTICLRAASFLLIPLYIHTLSMSDYGLLVTLLLSIQIMTTVMGIGTRIALIRFTTEYQQKHMLGHLLSASILINIAGAIFISLLSILFLQPLFKIVLHTDHVFEFLILACGSAFAQSLCFLVMSYYRAINDGMRFMIYSVVTAILLIVVNPSPFLS